MSSSSKRKLPENANFRARKKQKQADARTISFQTPQATENATGGPSGSNLSTSDSLKGLPSAIDVERFAESRAFEVNAMKTAMQASAASSTTRAWQVLPRHLRRRAASHDPRRVPLRLRDKARAEMDPVKKTKKFSKPKPGKGHLKVAFTKPLKFLNRQRDKIWLETHLWHAKRMHMENMWGYRLAITPTEKAFRPSHRASVHGSILHDASYHTFIELEGPENVLISSLNMCCDAEGPGPGSRRFISGARVLNTHIYDCNAYPLDLIAPVTLMWKPLNPVSETETQARKKNRKGKDKEAPSGLDPSKVIRTLWICVHPSVMKEVYIVLQTSVSLVLESIRDAGLPEVQVELAPLRGQLNMFEIMGPKSSQVIKGAFSPVLNDQSETFKKFWASLSNLQCAGSVPRGMVIGFTVNDPRLKFPPKNAQITLPSSEAPSCTPIIQSSLLAQSSLWEKSSRISLKRPSYTKKELDKRRSQNLVPGTSLSPLRKDDRIPVILIQRSVESGYGEAVHGWRLIIPAGWSMAFLPSLIFTGTRVGGQRERQTQAFEAGTVYFPRDYPSSEAYDEYMEERAEKEKAKWERTPPAKRINYEKLGTRSPWMPDWEVVLGLEEHKSPQEGEQEKDYVTTQRPDVAQVGLEDGDNDVGDQRHDEMDVDASSSGSQPWILTSPSIISQILSKSEKDQARSLVACINECRNKRSLGDLSLEGGDVDSRSETLLKSALIHVKVCMHSRGSPDDLAMIYAISDEELCEWREAISRKSSDDGNIDLNSTGIDDALVPPVKIKRTIEELSQITPSSSSIIGYVTTGNFSLSRGEGFGIGVVSLSQYLMVHRQAQRHSSTSKDKELFVKVRDRGGHVCRLAIIKLVAKD
ncbi:POP1-domain-containing protein [Dendrothele bispora CBS 962.96]|uniref:POP1-domain-containing protein n=1 Tax=Dendrothele bispora (strain CBS 962.96) TaxID=1314807 RepID=A0A4S8MQD3_DENBC|nr:POP1-domain-containing protein [Dendrothele bispora CBS 962.96]